MLNKLTLMLVAIAVFAGVIGAANPVCYSFTTGNLTWSENFDGLSNVDISTSSVVPVGFGFIETGTNADDFYTVNRGSANTGNTYSYGRPSPETSFTDRAFGGLRSGSNVPLIGGCFVNDTNSAIASVNITFDGEQWRLGTTNRGISDRLDFQYSLNATALTNGTWTDLDALDFSSPNTLSAAGEKNGNDITNRTPGINSALTSLSIPVGGTFYFRWVDLDIAGAEDGLAIDNFTMTVSNATGPSSSNLSISGRVVRADGRGSGGAYVRLAGGEGGERMVLTNPFGYYRFAGLAAGRTFFLTAGAKRFTFAAPTRTVTLDEDIAGLDFVSEQ
jgi:hypothetical protein